MDRRQQLAIVAWYYMYRKKKNKRKCWHKPWLGDYQRLKYSFAFTLEPLIFSQNEDGRHYVRMDKDTFEMLLNRISSYITKPVTNFRGTVTPREKLSITLSFLAEGNNLIPAQQFIMNYKYLRIYFVIY